MELSIHRMTKDNGPVVQRARVPASRHTSISAGDRESCEQLRFDRDALARLENEGGSASPVLAEQERELPAICNLMAGSHS